MDGLPGAVSHDDLVGRDADVALSRQLAGDELAQRAVSLRMGVDGEVFAFLVERVPQPVDEAVERYGLGVGVGDGEVVLAALDAAGARSTGGRALGKQPVETELA